MKAEVKKHIGDGYIRFTDIRSGLGVEEIEIQLRSIRLSPVNGVVLLRVIDEYIIPYIIEAVNTYKPKPKQDPKWPSLAQAAVSAVARRMDRFTTDDVWAELAADGVPGGDPKGIGPVMSKAAVDGIIERTDEDVKSRRKECHGRPVRVWKSLVCKK